MMVFLQLLWFLFDCMRIWFMLRIRCFVACCFDLLLSWLGAWLIVLGFFFAVCCICFGLRLWCCLVAWFSGCFGWLWGLRV